MRNRSTVVLDSGFGTRPGESDLVYRNRKKYAELAIEALQKQIPKTPIFEGDGYDNEGNIIYDTWYCPCCENEYETDYDDYEYCPECGQAIDWSDEGMSDNAI